MRLLIFFTFLTLSFSINAQKNDLLILDGVKYKGKLINYSKSDIRNSESGKISFFIYRLNDTLNISSDRNIKLKKYPFWRLDALFSERKQVNLNIVSEGGWHFTNLKTPEEMHDKFMNFGHHDEYKLSNLTAEKIREKVKNKEMFYNHFVDQSNTNKWESNVKLKNYNIDFLPKYLRNNQDKYKEWFDF